jgi:hemin uptake protein HemP
VDRHDPPGKHTPSPGENSPARPISRGLVRENVRPIPRTTSHELLGQRGELVIAHDGRDYRLRITQNGKLILTA